MVHLFKKNITLKEFAKECTEHHICPKDKLDINSVPPEYVNSTLVDDIINLDSKPKIFKEDNIDLCILCGSYKDHCLRLTLKKFREDFYKNRKQYES